MQEPSLPTGILCRAGNIPNSNDLNEFTVDRRSKGLGNSLKRKLQHFKDHSKLLGHSNSTATAALGNRAHSKSLNDINTPLAALIHASEPTPKECTTILNASTEPVSIQD